MGDKTKIEWTSATWNPIAGCSLVSAGCQNCYAMHQAAHILRMQPENAKYQGTVKSVNGNTVWTGRINVDEETLLQPLRWKKPRRIFVNSMSDLFHANVSVETRDRIFAVMALCPQHTFQILTKRADTMAEYFAELPKNNHGLINRWYHAAQSFKKIDDFPEHQDWCWSMQTPGPLPNVWLGVSVENQQAADERIPHLLRTPAAVRWLSCEPLLGAVDLRMVSVPREIDCLRRSWDTDGSKFNALTEHDEDRFHQPPAKLDWVVVGGESGPKARPMHPDWARSLRDQCQAAGVPFFFKQWGEWAVRDSRIHGDIPKQPTIRLTDAGQNGQNLASAGGNDVWMQCVGKKAAGRVLDGRTWDEFPRAVTV